MSLALATAMEESDGSIAADDHPTLFHASRYGHFRS
jgi:hypothetical protein